ncbi:hypothetical protein [Mariniphaga sediminis]|uniref:hypothetical protein n=1 Tax=Mariniphaga sediminis TaxID=1628158 RepID=UPI001558E06B|nr:hypothetical protein [Mariniphaga sediminis]
MERKESGSKYPDIPTGKSSLIIFLRRGAFALCNPSKDSIAIIDFPKAFFAKKLLPT